MPSWLLQFCSLYERIQRFAFAFYSHATAVVIFFYIFFVVDQNESKHKARRAGRRSASSGEVSGHSIFETLWRATSKQPLLLQLLVLCSLLWLELFLSFLSAFVYLVFFYTTHALTHTHKTKETEIIYLKFGFWSLLSKIFVFCLFIRSRKLLLASSSHSRLVWLACLGCLANTLTTICQLRALRGRLHFPLSLLLLLLGLYANRCHAQRDFSSPRLSMTHLIDWLSLLWQSVIALCTHTQLCNN